MDKIDENVKSIKPINSDTVHKICSGQVVLNLSIAVKEIVENSLDAGATSVEVRLKNYGIDLIEVSDNGSGVTECNFQALTMKYHTSKLTDYSDLLGVSSFGFRGEALSSLCELADMVITTRHQASEFATKLEYDHKGNIVKKTLCSRQVGTTVTLSNLFSSLPVRQKEFHKNAKREFNKMTQLLYAYCLISLGVKITCTNQISSNQKSIVVATQGSTSYKDNIACVFGAKQLNSLLELKPEYVPNIKENILKGLTSQESDETETTINIEDVEIDLSEDSNEALSQDLFSQNTPNSQSSTKFNGYKNEVTPVEFTGLISSCAHGSGRSSTDRQFYYINSRPCEPQKIIKLVNEIYRQYNSNQYPFVFLNVILNRTLVDVNLTPDKRQVFLIKEKMILDIVKSSMLKLFESIPRTIKVEQPQNFKIEIDEDVDAEVEKPKMLNFFLQNFANNSSKRKPSSNIEKTSKGDLKRKSNTILDFISSKTAKINQKSDSNENEKFDVKDEKNVPNYMEDYDNANKCRNNNEKNENNDQKQYSKKNILELGTLADNIPQNQTSEDSENKYRYNDKENKNKYQEQESKNNTVETYKDNIPQTQTSDDICEVSNTIICKNKYLKEYISPLKELPVGKTKDIITDKEDLGKINRRFVNLKTSLEQVKLLTNIYSKQKTKDAPDRVKFRSRINPVFNKKCEEELSREISKESFKKMTVIGQFNLGFIIAQLDDDLFIIDQHATDEIYNFETLQKTTELTYQKLVRPQQLELTGVNEQILMDNLEVFKKNGFKFLINEDALPTKRVKLLTIPMSKNWIFGKEDIEELLFMLRESPSEYCRPSRVRAMFASRACRKSVMIGTALSKSDMKRLIDHMTEIDKPWNCPHGRPTIRHLVNLAMIHEAED